MIIEIRETEFLAEIDGVSVVIKTEEHYLFGKWKYKTRELHSYNQALIQAFKVTQEPKKVKPIGYKTNSKQSKKKKSNENKSKTN
jgi:hypothetical protein